MTKPMFPSFLRQGSQGGTFLRLGVSRVDESNDIIGIHGAFDVATIAPEVRNAGCGLVKFFLLEKDSLNFQKQESNEFPCGKKGPGGHE